MSHGEIYPPNGPCPNSPEPGPTPLFEPDPGPDTNPTDPTPSAAQIAAADVRRREQERYAASQLRTAELRWGPASV